MSERPIDLIRLEGDGNRVILRITGEEGPQGTGGGGGLRAEFVVETPFVRGSVRTSVSPGDLREWQEALDVLDTGRGIVWREGAAPEPELSIERDDVEEDRVRVTIKDAVTSRAAVTVTVPLADAWFDDAYDRLDLVWKTWPPAGD